MVAPAIHDCARELNKKENRLKVFNSCRNACSENKGISLTGLKDGSLRATGLIEQSIKHRLLSYGLLNYKIG